MKNRKVKAVLLGLIVFMMLSFLTSPVLMGETIQATTEKALEDVENPIIDNQHTLSDSGQFTLAADIDDAWYSDTTIDTGDAFCFAYYYHQVFPPADKKQHSFLRWALAIPAGATITSATLTLYVEIAGGDDTVISRIDETNVGTIEGDASMPIITATNAVSSATFFDATGWRTSSSIVDIIQDQVDLGGWTSGYYIGLNIAPVDTGDTAISRFEDYSDAMEHRSYLNITWNSAPVNDATPTCTNLDDTDNLYARYKTYIFTSNVSDADGYADISYVELRSYDYDSTTLRWTIKYNEVDNVFSEVAGQTYIELDTSGSSYVKSGNDVDITWRLKIEWAHPDVSDDDLVQYVIDESSATDTNTYSTINYDYETRLNVKTGYKLDDGSGTADRGNYDTVGGIEASGIIVYLNSNDDPPPTAEVDVWITCSDTADTDWQATNYEASGGTFTVDVDSDDVVGLDTYTFKVVQQGAGSGGTDECHATHTDTYIADVVEIYMFNSTDYRDDVGTTLELRVKARLAYDDEALGSGDTVTLNTSLSMTWDASGWFDYNPTAYSYVNGLVYNITAATETTRSVTKWRWFTSLSPTVNGNYLTTGEYADYQLQTLSVEYWFMSTNLQDNNDGTGDDGGFDQYSTQTAARNYAGGTTGGFLFGYRNANDNNGLLRYYAIYNKSTTGTGSKSLTTISNEHEWYHIVYTANSTGYVQLFKNGVRVSASQTADFSEWCYITNRDLTIAGDWGYDYNIHVDELRFYNRILTAQEVYEHYYGAFNDNTGLISYWPFDGDYVDHGSAGNDGTVLGTGEPLYSSHTQKLVWDATMVDMWVNDGRDDIGDTITVYANFTYAYDGHLAYVSSVTFNGTAASEISSNYWSLGRSFSYVTGQYYVVDGFTDDSFGLTIVGKMYHEDNYGFYVYNGDGDTTYYTLTGGNDYTIAFWVCPNGMRNPNDPGNPLNIDIFNGIGSTYNDYLHLRNYTDHFGVGWEESDGTGRSVYWSNDLPFLKGVWYHVAVTWNGTGAYAYRNGVYMGVSSYVLSPSMRINDLGVGYGGMELNGSLRDFRVYSRQLTDAEINLLYHGQRPSTSNLDIWLLLNSYSSDDQTWHNLGGSGYDFVSHYDLRANPERFGVASAVDADVFAFPVWDALMISYSLDESREDISSTLRVTATISYTYDNWAATGLTLTWSPAGSVTNVGDGTYYVDYTKNYVYKQPTYISGSTGGVFTISSIGIWDWDGGDADYLYNSDVSESGVTAFTYTFWLRSSDNTYAGTVLSCSDGANHNEILLYNYNSFTVHVNGVAYAATGIDATDGTWNHWVWQWQSSDGHHKIYKNGVLVWESNAHQQGVTLQIENIVIGQEQDSFGGGFDAGQAVDGEMADIRLYLTYLDAYKIHAIYQGYYGYDSNLLIAWGLGYTDVSGTNVDDKSANNLDATIYGITTIAKSSNLRAWPIWDALAFDIYIDNDRYDLSGTVTATVKAIYVYDGSVFSSSALSLTTFGALSYSSGLWTDTTSNSVVAQGNYYVNTFTDAIYGLTKITSGFYFAGTDDRLEIPHDSSQTAISDMTIEGWFYPTSSAESKVIVAKAYGSSRQFMVWWLSTSQISLVYKNTTYFNIGCSPTGLALNTWHHFVITIDGSTNLNAWYDGVHYITDYTMSETLIQRDVDILIGCREYSAGVYSQDFIGYISHLRMYGRALDDEECYAHYQRHYESDTNLIFALTGSGLRGNAGTYGQWIDSTANNNDATAYSGAAMFTNSGGDKRIRPIWDTVTWELWINDGRVNINSNIRVYCNATYGWDMSVFEGTINLNGSLMTQDGDLWYKDVSQSTVGQWIYYISTSSDSRFGLNNQKGTVYLNGMDYWYAANSASLNWTGDWSVGVWFKFHQNGAAGKAYWTILTTHDGSGAGTHDIFHIYIEDTDNTTRGRVGDGSNEAYLSAAAAGAINDGVWHFAMITFDLSEKLYSFYLDGVFYDDYDASAWSLPYITDSNIYWGKWGSYNDYFDGFIGETIMYDGNCLSVQEAMELYQGQYPSGYNIALHIDMTTYSFSTGSDIFSDKSGNGNDVTIYNAYMYDYSPSDAAASEYVRPIWDEIEVYYGTISDGRTNVDEQEYPYFRLRLKYDNHLLSDGTNDAVNINGSVATWSGSGATGGWYKYYTQSTVGTWNFVVTSASENTYGITAFNSASAVTYDADIIWDAIGINMWISDGRDNTDDTITVYAWLTYMYDMTNVTDGSASLNGSAMSYGSSIWSLGRTQSTAGLWAYNITDISGNTYGITVVGWNEFDGADETDYMNAADSVSLSVTGSITVSMWFYIDSYMIDQPTYYILSKGGDSWGSYHFRLDNNTNLMRFIIGDPVSQWGADSVYLTQVLSVNEWHYITGVWDSDADELRIYWNGVLNNTDSTTYASIYDEDTCGLTIGCLKVHYYYFNGSIDSIRIYNRSLSTVEVFETYQGRFSNDTGLVFHVNMASYDVADDIWYDLSGEGNDLTIYGPVVAARATYHPDDDSIYVRPIWDSLTVTITNPTDQRININANATGMILSAAWDYDSQTYDGTLTLNDTTYDHGTVGIYYYTVTVGNGDGSYGITVVSLSSSVYCIFDEIEVYWSLQYDPRNNIDVVDWMGFRLRLKYDNHLLNDGTNDASQVNSSAMVWSVGGAYWYKEYTYDYVCIWNFMVTSASENTYGITALDSASATTYADDLIWDAIGINMWIDDGRDNIDDTITVYAWLTYMYDRTNVTDGTVLLNGTGMSYGSSIWSLGRTQSTAGLWAYNITSISGNTHGITEIGLLDFDGASNYVDFNDNLDMGTSDFTLETWFYTYNVQNQFIVCKGLVDSAFGEASKGYAIRLYQGYVRVHIQDVDEDVWSSQVAGATYVADTWYHIVATYDRDGNLVLYINGDEITSISISSVGDCNSTQDFTVGRYSIAYMPFNGTIDGVRVYTRLLSEVEVMEHYQGRFSDNSDLQLSVNRAGIDVADATWYDNSGNGVNGAIVSGTVNATLEEVYVRPIWDQIKVLGYSTNSSDNRDNIGTYVNITVWIQYDYDDVNVTDGTIVINSESFAYNAGSGNWTAIFSNATYSYATWNTVVAAGNTHGITNVNQNSKSQLYVWDEVEVYWSDTTDNRTNYNEVERPAFKLRLKYDVGGTHYLNDGTNDQININGSAATWMGDVYNYWYKNYNYAAVVNYTYWVTSVSEYTYGITAFDTSSTTAYMKWIIWDRAIVMGYSTNSTDNRDNINDCFNVSVWIQYEYDSTNITDGTVVINGDTFAYNTGSGNWTALFSNATASDATWDTIVVSGNTYGITYESQNGKSQEVIWDSLTITIIGPTDDRININANASGIIVSAIWDYDSLTYDGTLTLNDTTYDYGTVGIYYYTVQTANADDSYGISVINVNDDTYCIFDQVILLTLTIDDTHDGINTNRTIEATFKLEYDDHSINQDGADVLQVNGTTMLWNSSNSKWYYVYNYSATANKTFFITSVSEDSYGITAFANSSYYVWGIWDQVLFTFSGNMTWTVITYYINVSYTATYEFDSASFQGTFTMANLSMTAYTQVYEELTSTSVTNQTYYTLTVADDLYGMTAFTTNTVWCVFDNVTSNEQYYWNEVMTPTKNIFNFYTSPVIWSYNGTVVETGWWFYNARNGTFTTHATVGDLGYLVPYVQGVPYDSNWTTIAYSNWAYRTIGGRTYNFTWYSVTPEVLIPMVVEDWRFTENDYRAVISGRVNYNVSYYLYEDDNLLENGNIISLDGGDFDITWDKVVVGANIPWAVYFNMTGYDYWVNGTYKTSVFSVESQFLIISPYVNLWGELSIAANYYVYDNDSYITQGILTLGGFSINWAEQAGIGLHIASVYFNTTGGDSLWVNSSYYKDAEAGYLGHIYIYNSAGIHIDELNFRFYVNDTLLGSNYLVVSDSYAYEVTVKDVFNTTISTSTISPSIGMRITIEVYTLKVYSERTNFIYFNMTNAGGARYSEHVGPGETIKFLLYPGQYTYGFITVNGATVTEYAGTISVSADVSFVIDDLSIRTLINAVEFDIAAFTNLRPAVAQLNALNSATAYIGIGLVILAILFVIFILSRNLEIVKDELGTTIGEKVKRKLKRKKRKKVKRKKWWFKK